MTFWTATRVKRIAAALAVSFLVALPLAYLGDGQGDSLLKRGDFPGFYVLAKILKDHGAARLYDPLLQRSIENEIWPSFKGGLYMSVYPPYTALMLRPLAEFSPQAAQFIFTLLNFAALVAALLLLSKINASLAPFIWPVAVFSLAFAPLFIGVFGAQNTAVSMLLYSAAIYGVSKNSRSGDLIAGAALGAWLFKPQLGAVALVLALFLKRPYLACGAAVPALVFYAAGAFLMGPAWPLEWVGAGARFSDQNLWANSAQMISLVGAIKIALHWTGFEAGGAVMSAAGVLGSTCVLAVILWYCLKLWKKAGAGAARRAVVLLGPALVLAAPQVLFYDLGIALVSLLAVLDFKHGRAFGTLAFFNLLILPIVYFRDAFPIPLFPAVALLMLALVIRNSGSEN